MAEITHAKALRAIAAARRIEADRNAGPWHVVGGAHNTDIRDSADRVCAEWWGLPGNSIAICLWAGTFGALLDLAEDAIAMGAVGYESCGDKWITGEPRTTLKELPEPMVHPSQCKSIAALIETLDRVSPGWDKEAQ